MLNERGLTVTETIRRRTHVLVEFPDPRLESIIVQWERFRPTVLVQLKRDPFEPVQFPGKRPDVPGNDQMPKDRPSALDLPLHDFVDASTGRPYGREAFNADILFSQRAFAVLQPEPDLVLPPEELWEARTEALNAIGVRDAEGTSMATDLG
jgi:hypothetical protein